MLTLTSNLSAIRSAKPLSKLASSKADYENVANEIYHLREQKQNLQVENAGRDELQKRIADMSIFLREQPIAITNYDELLVGD
jgi:site-specific DNA recombinase